MAYQPPSTGGISGRGFQPPPPSYMDRPGDWRYDPLYGWRKVPRPVDGMGMGAGFGSGIPRMGSAPRPTSAASGMPPEISGLISSLQSGLSGAGQPHDYLQRLDALMSKLENPTVPQLDPKTQAALNARRSAEEMKINQDFTQSGQSLIADMFGRGLEASTISAGMSQDLAGRKSQALADLAASILGEETNLRNQLGGNKLQGLLGSGNLLSEYGRSQEQNRMDTIRLIMDAYSRFGDTAQPATEIPGAAPMGMGGGNTTSQVVSPRRFPGPVPRPRGTTYGGY